MMVVQIKASGKATLHALVLYAVRNPQTNKLFVDLRGIQ